METIKSRQNPKIRLARALRKRKSRDAEGLFLIEGTFHLGEAMAAGVQIEYLLSAPELFRMGYAAIVANELEAQGVASYQVPAEIITGLSAKENPSGLLAVAHQRFSQLDELNADQFSAGVAIVEPQDPGNLGTVLRTIDAAGASGLILLDGGVDAYHPTAVRAGMGAQFWKAIAKASFAEFAKWAKKQGFHIYGSSAHGQKNISQVEASKPFILLLGSEREGLSNEQLKVCDEVLQLPMRGRATSLNLAVAAGVLLYSLLGE